MCKISEYGAQVCEDTKQGLGRFHSGQGSWISVLNETVDAVAHKGFCTKCSCGFWAVLGGFSPSVAFCFCESLFFRFETLLSVLGGF